MQHSDLTALLAAGGVPVTCLDPSADEAPPDPVPKYNGMLDPAGAETLGRALAAALAGYHPTSVLVWEDPPDLILAHIVARELSATVVRAFDADGLVAFTGTFPAGARVVLLGDTFRDPRVVQALVALVHQQHGTPVAAAELFTVPGTADESVPGIPAVVLAGAGAPASLDQAGHPGGHPASEAHR